MNSNAAQTEQSMKHNGNRMTVKDFIILAKPGIIISNSLAALGGFWIAWLQSERTGGGWYICRHGGCHDRNGVSHGVKHCF